MSPLSYVLIMSSYNFVDLISCLRVQFPPILIECPHSSGGAVFLSGTKVSGYWDFGDYNLSRE